MTRLLQRLASTGAALVLAATGGAAASAVGAAPAAAAPLGTVRLPVTSGTVDATPIFVSATTSAPCPAGFGRNAQLRVGPPGGPYSNLARPLIDGGYDQAAVTARPNRSFATALGGAPADGEWWVVAECVSQTQGVHPERFVTEITVSGRQWRVGRPAGAPPRPGADASSVPAAGPTAPPAGPSAGASPGAAAPQGSAEGTPLAQPLPAGSVLGSASLANAGWLLALAGALAVVALAWRFGRRPAPAAARGRPRR